MAAGSAREAGDDQFHARTTAEVLADRLAMALVQHEPGWRLPRHTVLARRYNVSTAQIDAAISDLVGRHLIRRLPNGQMHRVSPVEYLIPLEGVPGLHSRIDPMAGDLTCRNRRTSWHRVPEDICWALRVDPAERVYVVHADWAAGGEPAAYATTYLPAGMVGARAGNPPGAGVPPAGQTGEAAGAAAQPGDSGARAAGSGVPLPRSGALWAAAAAQSPLAPAPCPDSPKERWSDLAVPGKPAALHVEMQLPPRSVARRLRLSAGQPATIVTVRFDDPASGRPTALTVAVLRPELFRIVVQTEEVPLPGGEEGSLSRAWAHTAEGRKS